MKNWRMAIPVAVVLAAVSTGWGQAVPASAPATAPGEKALPLEPQQVVEAFMMGVLDGNEKLVFGHMVFSSEEGRREAEAIVGETVVQQQLDALLVALEQENVRKKGGEDVNNVLAALNRPRDSAKEELRRNIKAGRLTVKDDAGELVIDKGPVIFLKRVLGEWKIDFEKTQRTQEGAPDKLRIAEVNAHVRVYRKLIEDFRAGKFKTAEEVNAELLKRMSLLPPPGLAEDTGPVDPKRKAAISDISNLKSALAIFEIDNARYPTKEEGLGALVKMPAGLTKTWRKQLEAVPKDPWGNDYVYRQSGEKVEIISPGPDGMPGTDDDLNQLSK